MSLAKLHHYVPQFYLRRFTNERGKLWAWDKFTNKTFNTTPRGVAAQTNFYRQPELDAAGHDPLTMEKQFSQLEFEVQNITDQWIYWLSEASPLDKIPMPGINREIVAKFIAIQHLRTQDTRSLLAAYAEEHHGEAQSPDEIGRLHRDLLWDTEFIDKISQHLHDCIWIFARAASSTRFQCSDHPVCFKSGDNRMWLKAGFLGGEAYAVYPMSPDIILYCHPNVGKFQKIQHFDASLSPVEMTSELVEADNLGQVFFSSRLVLSRQNDFEAARDFLPTIGTDTYAPKT